MAPTASKVTILFIQASPPDQQALDTGTEQNRLDDALWASLNRDVFDLKTRAAAHVDDLVPGLRRFRPQVVHFSGHGERHGDVVFSTPDGKASHRISAENFAETLRLYAEDAVPAVSLVVLAGCYTDQAAQRLSQFVGCAVGMADRVSDAAMVETFTPTLYRRWVTAVAWRTRSRKPVRRCVTTVALQRPKPWNSVCARVRTPIG